MNLSKSYMEERGRIFDRDGETYPARTLVDMELVPGYNRTKKHLLAHIRSINEAHLLMLEEQGIVTREDGAVIMKALEEIDYDAYRDSEYDGNFEDLYFKMEDEIIRRTNGVGGNLHLARSRNDMCVAWSHMAIRESILELMEQMIGLQNTVLLFAREHRDTLYVVHTHTQHAQPGILGHYFLGMVDVIGRDIERLRHAYTVTNVSPMGAAAITTSGFPVSRERVAELAGFEGVVENSYDTIGNIDYFTETASAISLSALNLGRIVTDMILWATEEMKMIRVADGYISTSSIMPQKRNPIALEHLRSSLSVTKGIGDAVMTGFLKSPYGDISDYEDIEDVISRAFEMLTINVRMMNAVLGTMDVNKELLRERAYESFSVVTEIADQMYRSYGIPFRQAHHFVAFLVKRAEQEGYNLKNVDREFFAETYEMVFHEPFTHDFSPILKSIDPEAFVKAREALGGTGPEAMEKMLESGLEKVQDNVKWLEERRAHLKRADEQRKELVEKLLMESEKL